MGEGTEGPGGSLDRPGSVWSSDRSRPPKPLSPHIVVAMRVAIVDPSAYTPPYDHALCSALADAGAEVELLTSRFAYGATPQPNGYVRREIFYERSHREGTSSPRGKLALGLKLAEHVPGMLRCKRLAREAEIVHFQWLTVQQIDWMLLGKGRGRAGSAGASSRQAAKRPPLVLTAHDVMPREPRLGQLRAQRMLYRRFDAIVVHSEEGKRRLLEELDVEEGKVAVIPHGIFTHLGTGTGGRRDEGTTPRPNGPVVLFFGLLRPYKGIDVLLEAWRMLSEEERGGAELRIAGMPRMDLSGLRLDPVTAAKDGISLTPRFVGDEEIPRWFEGADLVVLPYREADQSGVLFTALAFRKPLLLSDVGGFPDIAKTGAARLVPAGDADALAGQLRELLRSPEALAQMAVAAGELHSPESPLSWHSVGKEHLKLYERLLSE